MALHRNYNSRGFIDREAAVSKENLRLLEVNGPSPSAAEAKVRHGFFEVWWLAVRSINPTEEERRQLDAIIGRGVQLDVLRWKLENVRLQEGDVGKLNGIIRDVKRDIEVGMRDKRGKVSVTLQNDISAWQRRFVGSELECVEDVTLELMANLTALNRYAIAFVVGSDWHDRIRENLAYAHKKIFGGRGSSHEG